MTSLAIEGLKNNINNYKGVMLCTRPNENIGVVRDRPFVSRVDPKDLLGVNPVKRSGGAVIQRRVNPILQRHRAWLNTFKEKIREQKQMDETRERDDRVRFEKIKEHAARTRSPSYYEGQQNNNSDNQSTIKVENYAQPEQSSPTYVEKAPEVKPTKPAIKKKENKAVAVPKWAYTQEQIQAEEEEEVDDLLNFTQNLDYDKYINDLEVKNMVTALKNRIDELKNQDVEDDWKKKIVDQWNGKDNKKALQPSKVDIDMDARSDARSVASESRSVASERSNKSIVELKNKLEAKEKRDWDQLSTTTKKNAVTVEERIAKHVADEILRNNYQFKHFHSNASIRKLLEKEAEKHMEEARGVRGPTIVSNKEYFTRKDIQDPNNLPYLHRNPAI